MKKEKIVVGEGRFYLNRLSRDEAFIFKPEGKFVENQREFYLKLGKKVRLTIEEVR